MGAEAEAVVRVAASAVVRMVVRVDLVAMEVKAKAAVLVAKRVVEAKVRVVGARMAAAMGVAALEVKVRVAVVTVVTVEVAAATVMVAAAAAARGMEVTCRGRTAVAEASHTLLPVRR